MNLELMFQDNLPPETQILEDFINDFKDKDTKDDVNVAAVQEKAKKNKKAMEDLLPDGGGAKDKCKAIR
jgi:hypothetical protein